MKVVIDVARGRLSLEGDGPELLDVLKAARELAPSVKQIQIVTTGSAGEDSRPEDAAVVTPQIGVSPPSGSRATLRQFARSLTLANAAERIASIAYYVNKTEGRPAFSPKEMDGWFTMCGFQKPAQMPLAIFDTKRKYGYVDNVSRGGWRISTQGENLILRKLEESQERTVQQ